MVLNQSINQNKTYTAPYVAKKRRLFVGTYAEVASWNSTELSCTYYAINRAM